LAALTTKRFGMLQLLNLNIDDENGKSAKRGITGKKKEKKFRKQKEQGRNNVRIPETDVPFSEHAWKLSK
jgi:hypothetical protein